MRQSRLVVGEHEDDHLVESFLSFDYLAFDSTDCRT